MHIHTHMEKMLKMESLILPQRTVAIKLGHAGIVDPLMSNLSIPVYKNMRKKHQLSSSGNQNIHV